MLGAPIIVDEEDNGWDVNAGPNVAGPAEAAEKGAGPAEAAEKGAVGLGAGI